MAGDIALEILAGLSEEDQQEISSLAKPMVGDGVRSFRREEIGLYGGGQIVEIDGDDIRVCWWDPADGGVFKDSTIVEKDDFAFSTDGRSGRTWNIV